MALTIEQKGLNILIEHGQDAYDEEQIKHMFNLYDQELQVSDICRYLLLRLNARLQEYDIYIGSSGVSYCENSDMIFTDKTMKMLLTTFKKKNETVYGQSELEAIFGTLDEELSLKDIHRYLSKQLDRIVHYEFEYEDFSQFIE